MSESAALLKAIERGQGTSSDLGGKTRCRGDALELFDGRVSLTAVLGEPPRSPGLVGVHAHLLASLPEYDGETLDACVVGIGADQDAAVAQAAAVWLSTAAAPIRSFLDDKPCGGAVRVGDSSAGNPPFYYGFPSVRAFAGPIAHRAMGTVNAPAPNDEVGPWFRFAVESASPRRVHLAKTTVLYQPKKPASCELELDGHDVSHRGFEWPVPSKSLAIATRFAVFEFPGGPEAIRERAELERTIERFAETYAAGEEMNRIVDRLTQEGLDETHVIDVLSFAPIAFGRSLFEHLNVACASTILRVRRDGSFERGVPLASLPAYARAKALTPRLREKLGHDAFVALGRYSAETNVVEQAVAASPGRTDFSSLLLAAPFVVEPGTAPEALRRTLASLRAETERVRAAARKPWWKFW